MKQYSNNAGLLYILTNPAIPDLIKIGYTQTCVEDRIIDLSKATGIPAMFVEGFSVLCSDCILAEDAVHRALEQHRVESKFDNGFKPEFFKLSVEAGIAAILKHAEDFICKAEDFNKEAAPNNDWQRDLERGKQQAAELVRKSVREARVNRAHSLISARYYLQAKLLDEYMAIDEGLHGVDSWHETFASACGETKSLLYPTDYLNSYKYRNRKDNIDQSRREFGRRKAALPDGLEQDPRFVRIKAHKLHLEQLSIEKEAKFRKIFAPGKILLSLYIIFSIYAAVDSYIQTDGSANIHTNCVAGKIDRSYDCESMLVDSNPVPNGNYMRRYRPGALRVLGADQLLTTFSFSYNDEPIVIKKDDGHAIFQRSFTQLSAADRKKLTHQHFLAKLEAVKETLTWLAILALCLVPSWIGWNRLRKTS